MRRWWATRCLQKHCIRQAAPSSFYCVRHDLVRSEPPPVPIIVTVANYVSALIGVLALLLLALYLAGKA